ncbi:hypothetical protein AB0M47_21190 [Hamadaea sp. NPDC051192]|uniref:amidohydrolase family protein n=1 Tax=Hamadaea sp. NPDC051192 TaxID=3154940 RepID=UPI00341B5E48
MPFRQIAAQLAQLRITFDVDALLGAYPGKEGGITDPAELGAVLRDANTEAAAVASLRAALFDVRSGNDEVLATGFAPVGGLDLRDALGAERELDRLAGLGVRAIRLFPEEQHAEADFPAVRHLARRATELGFVLLTGGDVRRFWKPLAGLGATVVFLDTHFYHLGDFLVAAREEAGFHTSTRLLNSPDAVETVASVVGVDRLVYGSRTPYAESAVPRLRLARCGLSADEIALVAGGTAMRLLGVKP